LKRFGRVIDRRRLLAPRRRVHGGGGLGGECLGGDVSRSRSGRDAPVELALLAHGSRATFLAKCAEFERRNPGPVAFKQLQWTARAPRTADGIFARLADVCNSATLGS